MKRNCILSFSLAVLCLTTLASAADKEFRSLYKGKDLSGWTVKDGELESWQADGTLLSCVKPGGGWLRTKRTYRDFVLRLEYRIPEGGNSGVGLRFPARGNPAHVGMEIQVLDDDAPKHAKLEAAQYTGGINYQAAAKRGAIKPAGEWNSYEITCRGPLVKIVLNGKVINEVDIDKHTKGQGGHPALADRPRSGYIGLQSHGSRVDFRKLVIKDLTTTTKEGLQYTDIIVGKGDVVPAGATVTVHYTGRLADGKKFDSSRDRDQAATFSLQ